MKLMAIMLIEILMDFNFMEIKVCMFSTFVHRCC